MTTRQEQARNRLKKQRQRKNRRDRGQRPEKNIQISFRLSPYQLAHGLEILRALEPTYKPSSLTSMVKIIYQDWIAKMGAATKPWPTDETQVEIGQIMQQTAAGRMVRLVREDEQDLDLVRQKVQGRIVMPTAPEQEDIMPPVFERETGREAETEEEREPETNSTIGVVTDFSPPSLEELMSLGEGDNGNG